MENPQPPPGRNVDPPEKAAPPEQLADKVKETYQWWDNLATIKADDPLWLGAAKIGLRVLGIFLLLAMSPLILLGFLFAFIAVA